MIVELKKYGPRPNSLTDGTHSYWVDGGRVRWAFLKWKKNEIKTRTHGAAASLELAVRDAWNSRNNDI